MAVIVELKEEVIKVQVSPKGVHPDPVVARTGDIICWMWPKNISSSISQFKEDEEESEEVFFTTRFVCSVRRNFDIFTTISLCREIVIQQGLI